MTDDRNLRMLEQRFLHAAKMLERQNREAEVSGWYVEMGPSTTGEPEPWSSRVNSGTARAESIIRNASPPPLTGYMRNDLPTLKPATSYPTVLRDEFWPAFHRAFWKWAGIVWTLIGAAMLVSFLGGTLLEFLER